MSINVFAYFYPGWISNRSFDEWGLLNHTVPAFKGHYQPRVPLERYDLLDRNVIKEKIECALEYGLHGFIFCWYWDSGEQLLREPLEAFLDVVRDFPKFKFGLMWTNRRPHEKLPINMSDLKGNFYEAFAERNIETSSDDLYEMVNFCGEHYFCHPNYIRLDNLPFFAIFSVRDLISCIGPNPTKAGITLRKLFSEVYLVGVAHGLEYWLEESIEIGFHALTSYVLLPDWHGPWLQDYSKYAKRASILWETIPRGYHHEFHFILIHSKTKCSPNVFSKNFGIGINNYRMPWKSAHFARRFFSASRCSIPANSHRRMIRDI